MVFSCRYLGIKNGYLMGKARVKLCPVEREAQASWRGKGQPQRVCGGCEAGWLKSVFTAKTAPEKRGCVVK